MTAIKVLGINLQTSFDPTRSFSIAAFGDVALDDIETTLRGVALAWSHGSFVALPPKIPSVKASEGGAIQWNISGQFARDIRDKLLAAYETFGGVIPPGAKNHGNAARRIAAKRDSGASEGLRRFVGADE